MTELSDPPLDAAQKRALVAGLLAKKRAAAQQAASAEFLDRFTAQLRAVPQAEAVVDDSATLSYRALADRAAGLADRLDAQGIGMGDGVALALPRSAELAVAIVALASLGAPWTVLGTESVLRRQFASARPKALLVAKAEIALPAEVEGLPRVALPSEAVPDSVLRRPSSAPLLATIWPGTEPVALTTEAVGRQLAAAPDLLPLGPGDRIALLSHLQSEAMVLELLWPLAAGATVVIGPERPGPKALGAFLERSALSAVQLSPSQLLGLAAAPERLPSKLLVVGEPLTHALAAKLRDAGKSLKTALSLPSCAGPVLAFSPDGAPSEGALPLGQAHAVPLQIKDRHGAAVPDGVPGALIAGGHHTGLVVRRRRADQAIALVSEGEEQRLVDGQWLDPAAVAKAARTHPAVADAHAVLRHEPSGLAVLGLYVVPATATPPSDLDAHLAKTLPPWSQPGFVTLLSALPLTPQGDVDIAALAALPVMDAPAMATWQKALSQPDHPAIVLRHPVTPKAEPIRLPVPALRAPATTPAATGAPLGADRPAYASGGALALPPNAPQTLTEALIATAQAVPEKGVLITDAAGHEAHLSYATLLAEAQRIAGGLRRAGLAPGAPVILQIAAHRQYFPAFWGAVFAGLTPVTIASSEDYGAPSGTVLKLVNAWRLLAKPPIIATGQIAQRLRAITAQTGGDAPKILLAEDLGTASPLDPPHRAAPEDVLFLQLSSGSTGVPKIIQITHRGVVAHTHGDMAACGHGRADISVNWLPLDHVVPLLTCHLKDTYLGASQIALPVADVIADPLLWLRILARHRATRSWAPNFGYKLAAAALDAAPDLSLDLSSMRHFMNAGEQVTRPVIEAFLRAAAPLGVSAETMQPAFGMAEACTCMTYANGYAGSDGLVRAAKSSLGDRLRAPADTTEEVAEFVHLGPPVPGVEIRIADAAGQTVPEGVIGQLHIRGPVITPGYLANDAANAEAFAGDDWFNSGDLGVIVDGSLALTGRAKETIIINGANFYCYEIEDVVSAVPGVAPSFAAATSVAQDATGSEALAVFFVPAAGADPDAVAQEVRARVTAQLGVSPAYLRALTEESFPKTTSGKIQRMALKASLDGQAPDAAPAPKVPAWFHREVWVPKTTGGPVQPLPRLTVLGASTPLAEALLTAWRGAGGEAVRMAPSNLGATPPERAEPAVIAVPIETRASPDTLDAVAGTLAGLAAIARDLNRQKTTLTDHRILLVMRSAPAEGPVPPSIAATALRAGLRSLVQERPELDLALLQLPQGPLSAADAATLIAAIAGKTQLADAALHEGTLRVPRLAAVALDGPQSMLMRGGRYLVTGGLGQLGRALCAHLIESCDAEILALGRQPAETVAAQGASVGSRMRYLEADLADPVAVTGCLAAEEAAHGAFDGVFHLAGAADARALSEETEDSLRATLAAKAGGAVTLHAYFETRPEVPIIHFGSVNAVFGGSAAAGYSAANAVLDALARQRRAIGGAAIALHWSQWEGSALAAKFGLAEFATARGFQPVGIEAGMASMMASLGLAEPAVLIGLDGTNPHIAPKLLGPPTALERIHGFVTHAAASSPSPVSVTDRFGTPLPCPVTHLEALPSLPDGSLDRAALDQLAGAAAPENAPPQTDTERRIAALWCALLERPAVGCNESFFAIGGHSLVAARLMLRIREEFGRELPLRALFSAPTVAGMASALDGTDLGSAALPDCIMPLQSEGSGAPIFCVHPAGGSPLCYLLLANHLGRAQPFYGFQATGLLDDADPLDSVEAMAAQYFEAVTTIAPEGPLRLAAWSSGGPVAFEMARLAEAAGREVALLAMFDCGLLESDNPLGAPGPLRPLRGMAMLSRYAWQLRWPRSWQETRALGRMIGLSLPEHLSELRPNRRFFAELRRAMRLFNRNTEAAIKYVPQSYGGRVTLFRASGSQPARGADPAAADLARFSAGLDTVEIPGNHMSIILDPDGAARLAQALRTVLSQNDHTQFTSGPQDIAAQPLT